MSQQRVAIIAPSRLHFGMLSFGHDDERQFGGVGVMIEQPRLELRVSSSSVFESRSLDARSHEAQRIDEFARRFAQGCGWDDLPKCRIEVCSAPPQHCGLGSGTQLGLAVAVALSRWNQDVGNTCSDLPSDQRPSDSITPAEALELAAAVGRRARSTIGTYGFALGGMIIEAGSRRQPAISSEQTITCGSIAADSTKAGTSPSTDPSASPLMARLSLPDAWRFALVMPRHEPGLFGDAERRAFAHLPPVPRSATAELCRETLLHLMPAALCGDFSEFSASLFRFNHLAGTCFAASQGGPFASPRLAELVATIRGLGVEGVGQSSWGPSLFALLPHAAAAEEFVARLLATPSGSDLHCTITRVANRGAQIVDLAK